LSKLKTGWYSQRVGCDVGVARWGDVGAPVLLFPTAGGDAEEIERFHVIDALGPLLEAGRVKIYSCDSVAGRAMLTEEGSPQHRMWMQNQFEQFVYHELVPLIRNDCRSEDIGILTAGSSIGAFNALAVLARFPDAFTRALCLSGTYDLDRFLRASAVGATGDWYFSSPLHFIPGLSGDPLERLRSRFVLLASGEGEAEDIGESWRMADVLGAKGIPNRVDSWGRDWRHDWVTWRKMFPQYLTELTAPKAP
jgi:esterase/lipase superfamily enzyme